MNAIRAADGTRTRDLHLGKVTPYHLATAALLRNSARDRIRTYGLRFVEAMIYH